ncbi:hypothetical protein ACGFIR_14345 [Micromonospora sp. NPDC049051]|uniref:hypothetical protein n=1 Tax=Micromonospora sp. NPDC049051 TaxID=3364264 RepID=UPI00371F0FE5
MAQYADIKDVSGAITAASRLATHTADTHSVSVDGLGLVARTAALAPLFGDDDAGRRYRHNYGELAPELERMIQLFGEGVAEVGGAAGKLLGQLVESDDPRIMGG